MKIVTKILICFFSLLPIRFAGDRLQIGSKHYTEALSTKVDSVKTQPKKKSTSFIVTSSMYTVKPGEDPALTASGFEINRENPKEHRIVALSWDLKPYFKYGEKVLIEGIGKHSGIYIVRDLMHERWRNRIDILANRDDHLRMYYHVIISKLKNKHE